MKIKEVVEKTGLTDRAIRLYINEGLAAPNIAESYSGRKSIDFSDADVERLKNIATLRKAGFSIADIKCIADKKEIKEVIEKYIGETESEIGYKTEIVEKLKNISFDEDVTLETICNLLSATVSNETVPREDLNLTLKEKIKKSALIALACIQIAFSGLFLVMICGIIFEVRYIQFDPNATPVLIVHACWFIIISLSILILWLNTGKRFIKNSRGKMKGVTAVLVGLSIAGSVVLAPVSFMLAIFGAPFYSQTTDIENYMKFDESLEAYFNADYNDSAIYEVFPIKIPVSAKVTSLYPYDPKVPDTTKYYYKYTVCPDGAFGTYDICAEWILPNDEYERAKSAVPDDILLEEDIFAFSQIEMDEDLKSIIVENRIEQNRYKIATKGDWTMVYYKNDVRFYDCNGSNGKKEEEKKYKETNNEFVIERWSTDEYEVTYTFLICAYNDKEQKMRYIASECCGHTTPENGPYYLTLDW